MSCSEGIAGAEKHPGTGCCGSSCAGERKGCFASEPRIRSCLCQSNVGCLDRPDCGGFRPTGTAATGACPGPCQCAEEEVWNTNVPPRPNCEWLSNFSELRRQWSDHARQQNCKCCNCKPCRIPAPCRPCLPPTPRTSITSLSPSNCQECRDNRRLGGGANGEPEESSCRRESRGACCRNPSPRRRSPSFDRSSSFSSSRCPRGNQETSGKTCKPCCAPSTKFEPRKRDCCRCTPGYCMCQPMPRSCNCPPPVQVDARADRECSCDCPSSPECSCPPSERRFPRTTIACPNARACRPKPRLPPGPKCHCVRCQPCLPPPCDPCTSSDCRSTMPEAKSCMPDHDQRPVSADFSRQDSSCPRCCKVSWSGVEEDKWGCLQDEKSRRGSRGSSPVRKMAGVSNSMVETYAQTCEDRWKNGSTCCNIFSYLGNIGYSTLVPGPLALISFVILIFLAITLSSGLTLYRRYKISKKINLRHSC